MRSAGADGNGNFFLDYLTSAANYAFQQLYKNNSGSVTSWGKFWIIIAQTFDSYSNVLGYELINEPWVGDAYKNPSLLEPDVADILNLLPVYTQLNAVIRTVDTKALLFYKPVTFEINSPDIAGTGTIKSSYIL
ncbi:unnamed protein product [Didymodactylos carnosus]|uniref:Uncharacterized protein n=1 Tax=Didymodactylos carnosus TaxID=1234261 RepID=A0A814MIX5_9BILA|nr:unnamed protein product [Didymodactylos carnosus]CAF3845645.1 unnamed protein product [Didymodactylos carnosus]